jgi:hypothetical protein
MFEIAVGVFFGLIVLFVVGFVILCTGIRMTKVTPTTEEEEPQ